jgi:hypothetical protein
MQQLHDSDRIFIVYAAVNFGLIKKSQFKWCYAV